MSENKIHNMWPVPIGEFYNPEHNEIKNDLKLIDAKGNEASVNFVLQ